MVFFVWLGMAALVFVFQGQISETLKISNPTALWITVLLGLSSLCLPILRGVLQGAQNFFGLGWVAILDGVGRFMAVVLIIRFGGQAAGAMTGALAGQIIALSTAFWLTRRMLRGASRPRPWTAWLKNALPLSLASSSVLLMTGADVVFAAGNCGTQCADGRCQGRTTQTIMGSSALQDVLTLAGCDTSEARVGYSSQGPSIAGMFQQIAHTSLRPARQR